MIDAVNPFCVESWDEWKGRELIGGQSATIIDWMKSNDVEYGHIKK